MHQFQRSALNAIQVVNLVTPQLSGEKWRIWAGPAILVPEQFGGLAFGHVGMGQIIEETGRTLTASPLLSTAILGVTLINLAGSESQKAELLGKIANGDLTLALAIDEGNTTFSCEYKNVCN
jgi:alkylation response protein AidB-like acyl-CoA dehydrogenase